MIGDKIKAQRLAMGLTQEELAARMGYKSKSTINKIELNRIHFDRYRQLLEVVKTPYFSMVCGDSSNC